MADLSGADGHIGVAGAPQTGKSTLLRSLILALDLRRGGVCVDARGRPRQLAALPPLLRVRGRSGERGDRASPAARRGVPAGRRDRHLREHRRRLQLAARAQGPPRPPRRRPRPPRTPGSPLVLTVSPPEPGTGRATLALQGKSGASALQP
ncbi:FtsK/SpoIIIE domain-containing protein [Kitasatospora sp. NPDC096140]|uniref:FtsK/SpoIIIE domain-containing protein n=1 Tax=Kitasatospora sp. NPDC096140 TaxID=3155425 RepID=UPI00331F3BBD